MLFALLIRLQRRAEGDVPRRREIFIKVVFALRMKDVKLHICSSIRCDGNNVSDKNTPLKCLITQSSTRLREWIPKVDEL